MTVRARVWLAAAVGGAGGCDDAVTPPAAPPAPGVVLAIGDIRIERAELEPFVRYFEELDPTMGHATRMRTLLDKHVLPLHMARRAFPEERAEQRSRSEQLRSVADNYYELKRNGELAGGFEPERPFHRNELPLAIAMYGFRPEHLGQVSPPIETPFGWGLIAGRDIVPGVTGVTDHLHAFVIYFSHLETATYDDWLKRARAELARHELEYVDPELERALPDWIKQ